MKNRRKNNNWLWGLLAVVVVIAGGAIYFANRSNTKTSNTTLTVGVMTRNADEKKRWSVIQDNLKSEGVTLKFKEFTDYNQPNKALQQGEIDVNAFQHKYFLTNWNKENKGDLVSVAETYLSPIHLFSGLDSAGKAKYSKVSQLPDGATIAIPNDATNGSRALYLLQSAGLIKLNVSGDTLATTANISENDKNLKITEVDASQTARNLTSVDAAVINNSYATEAGVDYKTSLFTEPKDDNSDQWINIIAAQKDWKKSDKADAIKKLIAAYHKDNVKKVVEETNGGVDQPVW
ncbi:MetQ/NlpA family ABC transporter substrate-binding protein [Streptococcus sp. DD12]|uniref:MetQ/NlpA family ABC transporter substrate-binding protein n=1 Tax=Streptococcus sp. DD12 TaxID=1777880 RepID=UPI000799C035|nr:MetQ/NlpA family ABC transporter substrate-binding protein [Streptococcus sp. DD12]KXT75231.1 Methionine ABC transporter substrate-binding protein [Streptococcus sp. DD12]